MTRVQKTVLWTLAVCVFGCIAVHVLIVKAPSAAQAQQPALPEEGDRGGLGAQRAAPAPALEPARALVAVCVGDMGEPLGDVIVDIFRETATESLFDPRVESFGRTKTTDDGRLSVSLPLIQGKTKEGEAAAMYLVYFTAPGRPIKSMIVKNGTELPKQIAIPIKSTEHIYAPTHHIVVAKTKGISVSPLHSAIRAFTKDGKIYRVEEFVDERNSDDKSPGAEAVTGAPAPSTVAVRAVDGVHVAYPFKTEDTENDARKLAERYAGRANIHLESRPESLGVAYLHVRAPASVQDEIRAVVSFLTKQQPDPTYVAPPAPAKVAEPAVNGITVAYPFKTPDTQNDARRLQAQYFDRANITIAVSSPGASSHPHLIVRAPADVQAEIRAVVGFLTGQQSEPTDASGSAGDMSMAAPRQATQYGYLGLAEQQQQAAQERIRAARQQLSNAKTDDERKSARAQLRQLLAEIFSQDMQTRENQAAEIESRLSKLRQQYREREKVKDEIIDLQLKVIEQDAAGLGFPSTGPTTGPPPTGTGQTRIPESSEQSQIARERVETLRQQFKVLEREYQIGKVTIDRVLRASNDLLEAELEVAESAAQRIKILEQQTANLEMLEAVTTQVYRAGKVGVEDVLAAKADRLAAQTRLDRERNSSSKGATQSDMRQLQGILEYDGRRTITVFAPVDSRAERVYVDHVGTDVKKGDALVQLQSAELDTAEKEFLVARKSGQQSVLAAAQNRLRHLGLAQEQIDALDQEDEATGRLTLYSPTNGIVTSSHVVEGAGVKVNDQLFTIADPTVLWVQLEAPESALSWFHLDQPVTLTVDAYPETTYAGTIAFIEPSIDSKTRTVKIRVDLANPERKLKPGMTVSAFVSSASATPPTPIRSGNPFGDRSNLPASATPSAPRDPMIRGSGLPSPNVPATRVDQHYPIPTERTLVEVKKTHPAVVATLKERGHFIESKDGKLYAFAIVNYPSGLSIIRVIDSATGKLVATAEVTSTVGKLEFTKDGVNWHEKDGTVQLLVPLAEQSKLIDFSTVEGVVVRRSSGQTVEPAKSLHAGMTTEFSELRKQYLQAKGRWAQADTQFSVLLAEARKQNPKTSIDDVKKLHLDAWRENEQALRNYVAARHLIETKLELLDLDLKSAKLSVEVAESNLVDLIQKHKDKAALEAEVNQQRAVVKAAMLDVERVTQLIKLFTSVRSEPVPTSDARPTNAGGGDKGWSGDDTSFDANVLPGNRVPALASSAGVSVREMLAFKPEGAAIDYDQPSDAEIAACRVVLEPGEAWTLLDRDLVLLRRFVDKNHDGIVDLWAYYKSGKEVWRDVDTDFDGKSDHHEGVDCAR